MKVQKHSKYTVNQITYYKVSFQGNQRVKHFINNNQQKYQITSRSQQYSKDQRSSWRVKLRRRVKVAMQPQQIFELLFFQESFLGIFFRSTFYFLAIMLLILNPQLLSPTKESITILFLLTVFSFKMAKFTSFTFIKSTVPVSLSLRSSVQY